MNYLSMSSHNYTLGEGGATNCNLTPILPGVTRILCSYYVNTLSSRKVKKRKEKVNNKILVDLTHSQSQK